MNTQALVKRVAEKLDQSQAQTRREINILLELLSEDFCNDKSFTFTNFGTLYVHEKEAYRGYNPAEKTPMMVPKKRMLSFRISDTLKEKLMDKKF